MMRKWIYLLLGLSFFFFGLSYSAQVSGDDTATGTPTPDTSVTSDPIGPTDTPTLNPIVTYTPDPPTNYCSIVLAGQDFHISGGTGGVENDASTAVPPIDLPMLVSDLYGMMQGNGFVQGNEPVAILVVDDFRGGSLADGVTTDLSHGGMVMDHIHDVLDAFNSFGISAKISVYPVDAAGYDISDITAKVQNLIRNLFAQYGIRRFVVNMSYSILPCATVQEFEVWLANNPGADIRAYYDYLVNDHRLTLSYEEWIVRESADVETLSLRNNPLLTFITDTFNSDNPVFLPELLTKGGSITFIASAGNFGNVIPFQFYPAGWDKVIGVSGSEGNSIAPPATWVYSNPGDVMFPAAWYEYRVQQIWYAGTSFAAPLFSVIAALYATNDPIECPFERNGRVLTNTNSNNLTFLEVLNTPC